MPRHHCARAHTTPTSAGGAASACVLDDGKNAPKFSLKAQCVWGGGGRGDDIVGQESALLASRTQPGPSCELPAE